MAHFDTGLPRTAAISPRLRYVERTGSTNADVIAAAATDPGAWPHLSVLVTDDQTAGRGRLGRTWTAPPGAALAVSVLVRTPRLPAASRGWIPLAAGAAMTRAVRGQLGGSGRGAGLKWPNDVLLSGLKVCGILAEALPGDLDAVVIGSGINTRMPAADLPVAAATSFAVQGLDVDEDALLADYLTGLSGLLAALVDAQGDAAASGMRDAVASLCDTLGRQVAVALPDGTALRGTAERIDEVGRLVVVHGSAETAVSAGDVVHVR